MSVSEINIRPFQRERLVQGDNHSVYSKGSMAFKRIFDCLVSAVLLVIATPLMAVIALGIALTSERGAPILFRQQRVGYKGKLFTLRKFRTMVPNAEALIHELESLNKHKGFPAFKIENDPRITRFGRFLRRFSLDELPQLWNVLRGDMSLVGPRPAIPSEFQRYSPELHRRVEVMPGITGLSQVNGRSNLRFDEWMQYDLQYVDSRSLWLDLWILLRTPFAVISGRGAM